MRKTGKKIFLTVSLSLFVTGIYGETDWRKYGWQLYKNAGDARSIGLGNTMAADVSVISTLWNPSLIPNQSERNLVYGHQSRFSGIIQSDLIGFTLKTERNRNFNFLLLHESIGKIPNTQGVLLDWGLDGVPNTGDLGENNGYLDEGERLNRENISYFNQHQFGLHVSTQIKISKISFGIAIKTLLHKLDNHIGTGIGLDLGVNKTIWKNSTFGLAVQNIVPGMIVWDSGLTELSKPQLVMGIAQKVYVSTIHLKAIFLFDTILNINNQILSDEFSIGNTSGLFRFGTELIYNDQLKVRVGRNQYKLFAIGLGTSWENFELNYAYQFNSDTIDLGSNHVLSFSLNPKWVLSKLK